MKNIEGIIFDMDGTLFDTERVSFDIWIRVFEKYGYKLGMKEFAPLLGRNPDESNKILKKVYGEDLPIKDIRADIDAGKLNFVNENGVPVKLGAFELLDFLYERGYKIALATSTHRKKALRLLEMAGIRDKFTAIVCGDEVANSKPDPEIFLTAALRINANPEKCIVLEDSRAGMEAAYKAGMMGIHVPDLKEPDEEIIRFSHKICSSLLEVRDYLMESTAV